MQYKPGMIVKSFAGHDSGSFYVVVKVCGERVYIADGKRRKLEKPKAKNPIHLKATKQTVDILQENTNNKIRRVLHDLNYSTMSVQ